MNCYYHPEAEAVAICSRCGKTICRDCSVNLMGKITCQQCVSFDLSSSDRNTPISHIPTNILAIISLILGVLGFSGCLCGSIGLIFSIPGALLGYLARNQIKESRGMQQGMQIAIAGMILGFTESAVGLLLLILGIGGLLYQSTQ
jgi:hypothetical protein